MAKQPATRNVEQITHDAAREKDKRDGKDGQRAESSEGKGKQAEMEPAQ